MTGIHINKDPERLSVSVTAKGHAGIAPRGEDIICAAISTLIYGYGAEIATLDDRSIRERVVDMGKEKPADATVMVVCKNERTYKRVLCNLAPIEKALMALAEMYPHAVTLSNQVLHAERR